MNLGNGDGTFIKGTSVPGTPLAVADFNGDGKPDVLEQGQGTLEVLLGNGDGTFQTTPIITNIEASLRGVIAGDLRGDGKSDVLGFSNNELTVFTLATATRTLPLVFRTSSSAQLWLRWAISTAIRSLMLL